MERHGDTSEAKASACERRANTLEPMESRATTGSVRNRREAGSVADHVASAGGDAHACSHALLV
jgi:hypothetical protein